MSQQDVCPVCSVRIHGDTVLFSHGDEGTKQRLWARVCCHISGTGCINNWDGGDRQLTEADRFGQVETHEDEILVMMKQWFDLGDNDQE